MKKFHLFLVGLTFMYIVTSLAIKQKTSSQSFEKTMWVELDASGKDSVLFQPYSKAWKEMWQMLEPDIKLNETPVMNFGKYKFSFDKRTDNLFTIIHPMIINGSLQLYSPYQPESMGFGSMDDGELRYPIKGKDASETFETSETFRNEIGYYLGIFGPESEYPMVDEFGEPMVITTPDGILEYKYPPRDFIWYEDRDIVKYKVRVSVLFNQKGVEKKRIIKSIAPVVSQKDGMTGEVVGELELFWLDFEELTPTLKEAYYFDETGKPLSYLRHIEKKVFNAAIK